MYATVSEEGKVEVEFIYEPLKPASKPLRLAADDDELKDFSVDVFF